MNLLIYEFKKIINASFIKMFLFLIIIVNIIFGFQNQLNSSTRKIYLNFHEQYASLNNQELSNWLIRYQDICDESKEHQVAYNLVKEEIKAYLNYESYRDSIVNRYQNQSEISIFNQNQGINNQYNKEIYDQYQNLNITSSLKLQPYYGIKTIFQSDFFDFVLIIFSLYLIHVIFIQELKNGQLEFAKTTYKGRAPLICNKILLVFICLSIFTVISYCSFFLISILLYGNVDLFAAIQSIDLFQEVAYDLNIINYSGLYIASKLIGIFFLSVLIIYFSLKYENELLVTLFLILVVVVEYSLFQTSFPNPTNILRIWNIFSFFQGYMLMSYDLLQLFSYLLNPLWGYVIVVLITLIIIFIVLFGSIKKVVLFNGMKFKIKTKVHSLMFYEFKKFYLHQGALYMLVCFIVILNIFIFRYEQRFTVDEYYYHYYIDKIGDKVNDDTIQLIHQEQEKIENLYIQLSRTTNMFEIEMIENKLECEKGFNLYVSKVNELVNSDQNLVILKDKQYSLLFDAHIIAKIFVMMIYMSFAFLIPTNIFKEKNSNVNILQKTTYHGRIKLWLNKAIVIFSYFAILTVSYSIMILYKATTLYDLKIYALIKSLMKYDSFPLELNVITFYLIIVMLQLLVCGLLIPIFFFVSSKMKNQYFISFLIIALCVLPIILSIVVNQKIFYISFDCFYLYNLNGIAFLILLILAVISLGIVYKYFKAN